MTIDQPSNGNNGERTSMDSTGNEFREFSLPLYQVHPLARSLVDVSLKYLNLEKLLDSSNKSIQFWDVLGLSANHFDHSARIRSH